MIDVHAFCLELNSKISGLEFDGSLLWSVKEFASELAHDGAIIFALFFDQSQNKEEFLLEPSSLWNQKIANLKSLVFFRKSDINKFELMYVISLEPGRGWATKLLKKSLDALSDRVSPSGSKDFEIFLEIRPSNLVAKNLYEKLGFRQIGARKDYYPSFSGGREDALVMSLLLGSSV